MAPRTRSNNTDAHPGAPDLKFKRCSADQVREDKEAESKKKCQTAESRALVLQRITDLEDELGITQMREKLEVARPPMMKQVKVECLKSQDAVGLTADEQEEHVCCFCIPGLHRN